MPFGDRTGPSGLGPMTGRAAGFCAGYSVPGYMNRFAGRGMALGYGRGIGRGMAWRGPGFRHGGFHPYAPVPPVYGAYPYPYESQYKPEQEAEALKDQAQFFEDQLKSIRERITELESEQKE